MPEQIIVKTRGFDTPATLIGKRVIVTKSWYTAYEVGDIYHVVKGQWCPKLLKQGPDGSLYDIHSSGYDAEFALYNDVGEQLSFNFSSNQNSLETLDW